MPQTIYSIRDLPARPGPFCRCLGLLHNIFFSRAPVYCVSGGMVSKSEFHFLGQNERKRNPTVAPVPHTYMYSMHVSRGIAMNRRQSTHSYTPKAHRMHGKSSSTRPPHTHGSFCRPMYDAGVAEGLTGARQRQSEMQSVLNYIVVFFIIILFFEVQSLAVSQY